MLAQYFLAADALGLTEAEHDALVRVLGMLEREEATGFHMVTIVHPCGSPACLLGWARAIGNDEELLRDAVARQDGAYRLFFPNNDAINSKDQSLAALALRNYLTLGEPRWAEVLETS